MSKSGINSTATDDLWGFRKPQKETGEQKAAVRQTIWKRMNGGGLASLSIVNNKLNELNELNELLC